jgi:transcriptional regulator with XRE-family HTH domain
MITTEKELKITQQSIQELNEKLQEIEQNATQTHPILLKGQIASLKNMIKEMSEDITNYEILKKGDLKTFKNISLLDIHKILIQVRIAKKWTQEKLAKKLGLTQQQIQRYEAQDYGTASLNKIKEIVEALEIPLIFEPVIIIMADKFGILDPEEIAEAQKAEKKLREIKSLWPIAA